jgi:uncharacterized protein
MTTLRPVAAADRHLELDLLRGLGVLGILAVNAAAFALPFELQLSPELSPHPWTGANATAWWVMATFFEFKFITLFSLLFGVSIFLVGGERSDLARGALLRRRLFWLAVFGLIHGLAIWYGDILLLYAWSGLFMLLMRSWSARKLFWIGLTVVVLGSLISVGQLVALEFAPAEIQREALESMAGGYDAADVAAATEAMRGDLMTGLRENAGNWVMLAVMSLLFLVFRTVGLMMIGLALYRWGFLTGRAPAWLYGLLIVATAGSLYLVGLSNTAQLAIDFAQPQSGGRYGAANELLSLVITLGYASAAILLIRAAPARRLLAPVAAVGRMAFTNYLTQSLIMTTIFYGGRGLGLFGSMDHAQLWLVVFAVWALQLVWSPLWLSRFRMGPLEWVWRRLTYGKGLARAGGDQPPPMASETR